MNKAAETIGNLIESKSGSKITSMNMLSSMYTTKNWVENNVVFKWNLKRFMSFDQADCVTELSTSKIDILKNLDAFMLICNSL